MKKHCIESNVNCSLFGEIKKIFSPIKNIDESKIQIFVHGSWADDTKTAFSDLDDFIIVEDDYYKKISKWINHIELKFYQIDPLQHHGHWLIKKSELENYNNSYMPLFILKDAVCVLGSNKIEAKINPVLSFKGNINRIQGTCKNIEYFYQLHKEKKLNLYNLKRFVGSISLLPSLLFQIKMVNIDKPTALNKANLLFSKNSINLISWATDLRKKWIELTENIEYNEYVKKIKKFKNGSKLRKYSSLNSPILDYSKLSDTKLSDELIDLYIRESLYIVDSVMLKELDISLYEKAFKKVEQLSIKEGAILVGRFGTINHPSISDLDVFICFEDKDYKHGCEEVNTLINSDLDLSYFFPHTPLFVCSSMLNKIKYLHTLTNLSITYSKISHDFDLSITNNYKRFLNLLWSYQTSLRLNNYITNDLKYIDIRLLLLILKIVYVTIDNLEKTLNIESSNALLENNRIRNKVNENEIGENRYLIENSLIQANKKIESILLKLDNQNNFQKVKFKIGKNIIYKLAKKSYIKQENKYTIYYLNKTYLEILFNIKNRIGKNCKLYLNTILIYLKIHRNIGGYIDRYNFVFHDKYLEKFYIPKKIYYKLKKILKI